MDIIAGILKSILDVIAVSWWILMPLGLFFIWNEYWVWGMHRLWARKLEWTLIEVKIPKEILKTPKAMENVFSALHAMYHKSFGFEDIYFRGEAQLWISCELVGYAGGVHFYIRFPKGLRNLVESALYSEYPDAELKESDDYTELFPNALPNDIYDLWGNDYVFAKENPYPIKTYEFFEDNIDERRLDPISAITEVMSRLKEGEAIWLQYLVKPVPNTYLDWQKEGEALRDKMMQRKKEEKKGPILELVEGLLHFIQNFAKGPVQYPTWPGKEKKDDKIKMNFLSPGEQNVLKAIENKISKPGFETGIRFLYIDRKDSFSPGNVRAVDGAIRQFNTQDMNGFKVLGDTVTFITGRKLTYKSWFRGSKMFYRKRLIYDFYKYRVFPPKTSIMNTEELATVFHFPLATVEAPLLRRVGTRKGEPPAGLPIE